MEVISYMLFSIVSLGFIVGFIVILMIGFQILKTIMTAQPNMSTSFENDEPDGSNYYEVNGETRLE